MAGEHAICKEEGKGWTPSLSSAGALFEKGPFRHHYLHYPARRRSYIRFASWCNASRSHSRLLLFLCSSILVSSPRLPSNPTLPNNPAQVQFDPNNGAITFTQGGGQPPPPPPPSTTTTTEPPIASPFPAETTTTTTTPRPFGGGGNNGGRPGTVHNLDRTRWKLNPATTYVLRNVFYCPPPFDLLQAIEGASNEGRPTSGTSSESDSTGRIGYVLRLLLITPTRACAASRYSSTGLKIYDLAPVH